MEFDCSVRREDTNAWNNDGCHFVAIAELKLPFEGDRQFAQVAHDETPRRRVVKRGVVEHDQRGAFAVVLLLIDASKLMVYGLHHDARYDAFSAH